jgi:hypothetical protein
MADCLLLISLLARGISGQLIRNQLYIMLIRFFKAVLSEDEVNELSVEMEKTIPGEK